MAQIKQRSDNFIARLERSLDSGLKRYLPDWLYKQVTFQPDRAWRPTNHKAAIAFDLLLIAIAFILLLIFLKQS